MKNLFKKVGQLALGELLFTIAVIAVLAALLLPPVARAATAPGFDTFEQPTTIVLCAPTTLNGSGGLTNQPALTRFGAGNAEALLYVQTNTGTNGLVLTCTIQGSPDTTNWTTLASFAQVTNTTSFIFTNMFYGVSGYVTNTVNGVNVTNTLGIQSTNNNLFPFSSVTTPVAATAGFATPYNVSLPFTNNSAITLSGGGWATVGFCLPCQQEYLRTIWTATGSYTNLDIGAVLIAPKKY